MMCDDLTKQEILFFTVLHAHRTGISEDEIFDEMSKLAKDLGWPSYLNSVPRPLSERLEEARDRSMIAKLRPLHWEPTIDVAPYVSYLANRYLEKQEQRDKVRERLAAELHEAS